MITGNHKNPISERRARFILALVILAFALFTSLNLLAKYQGYADLPDLLVFETLLHNTLRGDFMYAFREGDVCHLGIHFSPLLLIYLPFYAVYQHVFTLFLVQGLWVGMGAAAAYLLGRKYFRSRGAALIMAAALLINPIVTGAVLWSIHEDLLAFPLLMFALYFFVKRKISLFWLFIFLALLSKEFISLVVFFTGPALWWRFRNRKEAAKTGILLMALGLGWFFLTTRVLMPLFSPMSLSDLQISARFDPRIGHSVPEMAGNFFRHPLFFIRTILQKPKILYLVKMLLPFAFACILSPALLLPVLPVALMNLLSHKVLWHSTLLHQYTIPAAPFLFIAAIDGFRRLRAIIWRKRKKGGGLSLYRHLRTGYFPAILLLAFSLIGFFVSDVDEWALHTKDKRKKHLNLFSRESRKTAEKALAVIPPDAAVSASFLVANHLAKRKIIHYNREPEITILPYEYFVIVKGGMKGDAPESFSEETIEFFREKCEPVFARGRFLVLKRKTPPPSLEEFRDSVRDKLERMKKQGSFK